MFLLLGRKEVVKLQSRLCDFVLKFQVSRRACYSFWGRTNLVICRWNFADPCKDFGAWTKKPSSRTSHRHLVGTDFFRSCLRMSPKLATAQLPTVHNRVFQSWRLKTTGQVSTVQFSCTKKLLMKLEVNQYCHAFQEVFIIWFPNQLLAW